MTTVPTQPYRPPSSALAGIRTPVVELLLIRAGRALVRAGERRARLKAQRLRPGPWAAAVAPQARRDALLRARDELRADAQAAAHSGLRVR